MAVDTTFKTEMQELAQELINEDFASVAETVAYTSLAVNTASFNTVTGKYDETPTNKEVKAIRNTSRVKARDDRPLTAKEEWLIISALDLGTITPQPGTDYIKRSGKDWAVVDSQVDPATARYQLHVRLP